MSLPFFTVPPVYLLDASSVIRLDGKDRIPPILPFSSVEQALIWEGLEDLAQDGRLKLIKQVKDELKRHDPDGLNKLKQYPGQKLILKRTVEVVRLYRDVTNKHPDLMKGNRIRFDPADPWLIVAAEKYGYTIISEELERGSRSLSLSLKKQNEERIPDVCKIRKLNDAIKLRDLALQLGWVK